MKLIIKEYLTSLKERSELDALLPDLLSQMGLHVFSKPSRGTRQYGVDIAIVGKIEEDLEKVFLLSVKSGNLGRKDWDSGSPQDLRPSLNEILDVYIPTHLPPEYKDLPIDICICIGGNVEESIRSNLTQYEKTNQTEKINIVEWDGDRLAEWIEKYFLQENLLPEEVRPSLRKSIALLDEPQASFAHFANLVKSLTRAAALKDSQILIILRQLNVCLWILFTWARDTNNLESSYLSAELALLHAWEISKKYRSKQSKAVIAGAIMPTFFFLLNTYQTISKEYTSKILFHTGKRHALSTAVHPSSALDINLKLFEVLGRLSIVGLWTKWNYDQLDEEMQKCYTSEIEVLSNHLKQFITNNPILFLPIKDDQAIDISLAILFLSFQGKDEENIINWLSQILDRAIFSYKTHGSYPCIHRDYFTLLDHPEREDDDYRQEATSGSILYPIIGLWAALLKNEELYRKVQVAKEEYLSHCNFQFWYPGETTENHLYENDETHGAVFSQIPIEQNSYTFLKFVWDECEYSDTLKKLSCVEAGLWPILLVACRHYRLPVPVDFTLSYRDSREDMAGERPS